METTQILALLAAIDACGNAIGLARAVGVTPQAINDWKRRGRVPAERVVAVEAATGGLVTRFQLRPDLYGRPAPDHPVHSRRRHPCR